MSLLEKYKEEINQDLFVNEFNIKDIQLKLPARKHFWAARLIDAKINLSKLQKRRKTLKKQISQKLIEEAPIKMSQVAADSAADNTDEIIKLDDLIRDHEYIIEYLEKVEKIMQTMHWEIKNIIDIQKLEQL